MFVWHMSFIYKPSGVLGKSIRVALRSNLLLFLVVIDVVLSLSAFAAYLNSLVFYGF